MFTRLLLPPHSFTASIWGPSHRKHSSMSFPSMSNFHRLLFFMNCSSTDSPWCYKSCQQTSSSMGSSLHRTILPGSCSMMGFPQGDSLLQATTLSRMDSFIGCSPVIFYWLHEDNLLCHGLHYRLQEKLHSVAWSSYSPSFFTVFGACRLVALPYSHLSLPAAVAAVAPLPFLNMLF